MKQNLFLIGLVMDTDFYLETLIIYTFKQIIIVYNKTQAVKKMLF